MPFLLYVRHGLGAGPARRSGRACRRAAILGAAPGKQVWAAATAKETSCCCWLAAGTHLTFTSSACSQHLPAAAAGRYRGLGRRRRIPQERLVAERAWPTAAHNRARAAGRRRAAHDVAIAAGAARQRQRRRGQRRRQPWWRQQRQRRRPAAQLCVPGVGAGRQPFGCVAGAAAAGQRRLAVAAAGELKTSKCTTSVDEARRQKTIGIVCLKCWGHLAPQLNMCHLSVPCA